MTRIGKDHFANRDPDPIFDLKNNDNKKFKKIIKRTFVKILDFCTLIADNFVFSLMVQELAQKKRIRPYPVPEIRILGSRSETFSYALMEMMMLILRKW